MGRIEDALRKLQSDRKLSGQHALVRASDMGRHEAAVSRPTVPAGKAVFEGPRHHVSLDDLISAGLQAPADQAGAVASEFRRIKRPLIDNAFSSIASDEGPMNVILVAGAMPGVGKSFCAMNLALSLSLERELNVLLLDADVIKPQVSKALGLGSAPGLIDLLYGDVADAAETLVHTDLNDIAVIPAGRSHSEATELLASGRMSQIVAELGSRYSDRIVVVDSPPLLLTSEAQALARQVGQIALVVESGVTTRQVLDQALEALPLDKAVNLILNKNEQWGSGHYYGDVYAYQAYQ